MIVWSLSLALVYCKPGSSIIRQTLGKTCYFTAARGHVMNLSSIYGFIPIHFVCHFFHFFVWIISIQHSIKYGANKKMGGKMTRCSSLSQNTSSHTTVVMRAAWRCKTFHSRLGKGILAEEHHPERYAKRVKTHFTSTSPARRVSPFPGPSKRLMCTTTVPGKRQNPYHRCTGGPHTHTHARTWSCDTSFAVEMRWDYIFPPRGDARLWWHIRAFNALAIPSMHVLACKRVCKCKLVR